MHIYNKLFIIYSLIFILIRIRNLKKKNIKNILDLDEVKLNTNKINDYNKIVIYKPKKNSGFNFKEVFSNIMSRYTNLDKFENNIIDSMSKETNMNNQNDEKIILNIDKENINLDNINNFLIYTFQSNKDKLYKVKCNILINKIKNINLIISDSKKRFVYDFSENNNLDNLLVTDYGFILDNNKFDNNDNINIYLIFYSDDSQIIINNIFLEIAEFNLSKDENAIIIFNIADKNYPLFSDNLNILDFEEYNNKNNFFFI